MNGLELAITRALDKADRSNPEIRARIYQSARQALEAGLRKQEINDPDLIARHRHQLEETIRVVEAEERARMPAVPEIELPANMTLDSPMESRAPAARGPSGNLDAIRPDRFDETEAEAPAADDDETPIAPVPAPEKRAPRKHKRGYHTRLFIWAILLASLAMGGWWVFSSGLLMSAAERDTSVPNPPASVEDENFDGTEAPTTAPQGLKTLGPQAGFTDDWLEIVGPTDAAKVTARASSSAEPVATGDGPAILVTSSSAGEDGKVELPIGAGTAGKIPPAGTVQVAMTVRGTAEVPVEISVECGFGTPESCGRHRFLVPPQKTDVLLTIPAEVLSAAGADAVLLFSSDVEGKGRAIDLFGVRVLPPQS